MRKFPENIESCSPEGISEIDRIHTVGCKRDTVGNEIKIFRRSLIRSVVAKPERQQKHKDIQRVGIKYGCCVETHSANEHGQQLAECPSAVQVVVIPVKNQPAQRVQDVYQQYPPDKLEIKVVSDMIHHPYIVPSGSTKYSLIFSLNLSNENIGLRGFFSFFSFLSSASITASSLSC